MLPAAGEAKSDPWTATRVRTHVEGMVPVLVDLWERLGEFPTMGFLFVDGDCIAVPQVAAFPKEVVPLFLREAAAQTGATFVGLAAEALMVEFANTDTTAEAWAASGRSLSEHPDVKDCLCLTADGPGVTLMVRTWKDATGEVCSDLHDGAMEGRMTNLSGRLGEN